MDTIHEDLNRVREKPYVEVPDSNGRPDSVVAEEQWECFLKRNQSVIVDLFYGQYKSHVVCTRCKYVSNKFEPFLSLTVPIPTMKQTSIKVNYFPRNMIREGGIKTYTIYLS